MTGEKRPKVSILMNCYNSSQYLKEAIDSVYAQTLQDFEIVFIDNCSTDNSAEIAKSYDSRLKYYKTDSNIPLFTARAFAMQFIRGEFLTILDCDDLWHKNKLQHQVNLAEKKQLNFLFSNFSQLFMLKGKPWLTRMRHSMRSRVRWFKRCLYSSKIALHEVILNYYLNIQTVMIRVDSLQGENFSKNLMLLGDYEFFIRLMSKTKLEPYYDKATLSITRIHPNQLTQQSQLNWYREFKKVYRLLKPYLSKKERRSLLVTILIRRWKLDPSNPHFNALLRKIRAYNGICFSLYMRHLFVSTIARRKA